VRSLLHHGSACRQYPTHKLPTSRTTPTQLIRVHPGEEQPRRAYIIAGKHVQMRETCRSRLSTGEEAHITQAVAAANRCCQASYGEIKFALYHPPSEIEELSSALELLRAATKVRVRCKEIHPFGGAPKLEQHDAPPVKLEQIHPVGRMQRIEPHGNTPLRVGFPPIIRPTASKIWIPALSLDDL
jgi:hypothetical protein